jgi:hypothetical protein
VREGALFLSFLLLRCPAPGRPARQWFLLARGRKQALALGLFAGELAFPPQCFILSSGRSSDGFRRTFCAHLAEHAFALVSSEHTERLSTLLSRTIRARNIPFVWSSVVGGASLARPLTHTNHPRHTQQRRRFLGGNDRFVL